MMFHHQYQKENDLPKSKSAASCHPCLKSFSAIKANPNEPSLLLKQVCYQSA